MMIAISRGSASGKQFEEKGAARGSIILGSRATFQILKVLFSRLITIPKMNANLLQRVCVYRFAASLWTRFISSAEFRDFPFPGGKPPFFGRVETMGVNVTCDAPSWGANSIVPAHKEQGRLRKSDNVPIKQRRINETEKETLIALGS